MNELLKLSAVELARRIREREASPSEVVETHIRRIEQVNPSLNAVVETCYERARAEARSAEERLAAAGKRVEELPPFLGVPCTIKEHMQVEGMRQTGGLVRRKDVVAPEDATLVRRMREAGFIVLGTTNVPEGLMWLESYNRVYGRTKNAYSPRHISGGSSGGEASIIGAGGSPVGLGGDIGGSIRQPAFFNGVAGHKATGGRIPETGTWPGVQGPLARYKVMGPLARRVEDLQALMPLLAGQDGKDASVDGPAWGKAPAYTPRKLRVYWFDDNGIIAPSDEIRDAVHRSVTALKDMGFQTQQWRPNGSPRALEIWAHALNKAGGRKFRENLGDGVSIELWREWLKWPWGRSNHIFPSLALATIERLLDVLPRIGRDMSTHQANLRQSIEEKLGEDGVLLFPSFHRTAPRHGLPAMLATLGFTYCGMLNPLELPSTAVPTGLSRDEGLPTGVQIAGARNQDHLTLFVARQLEHALGGWQPPTQFER